MTSDEILHLKKNSLEFIFFLKWYVIKNRIESLKVQSLKKTCLHTKISLHLKIKLIKKECKLTKELKFGRVTQRIHNSAVDYRMSKILQKCCKKILEVTCDIDSWLPFIILMSFFSTLCIAIIM